MPNQTTKNSKKLLLPNESSVQVTKNCWAVVSEKNPEDIWKDLSSGLFRSDRVMVIQTIREAIWYNVICTDDWLHYNLGEGDEKAVSTAVKTAV